MMRAPNQTSPSGPTAVAVFAALLLALTASVNPSSLDAQAAAATPTRLRIGMMPPRGSPWDRVARAWSNSLREGSGSTLELAVTTSVADEAACVSGLLGSTFDMVLVSSIGLSALTPAARVLDAPGALSSYAELDRARAAVGPELDTLLSAQNVVSLGWLDFGEARFFSTTSIAAPADLAARRTWRSSGDALLEQILLAVGGTSVVVGTAQVLTGLTGGTIDTVFASATAVSGLSWHPHLRYVTTPSAFYIGGAVLMRRDTYLALSVAQRTALDTTAAAAISTLSRTVRRDESRYYTALTTTHGVTGVDITPNAALWDAAYTRARNALVGSHYTRAMLDTVVTAGR